jgi:hypothetical protein
MPLTTLNMAVVAPTPKPTVSRVTVVNIGDRINLRTTCRKPLFVNATVPTSCPPEWMG